MENVLVGVAGAPESDAALCWALAEAAYWGASVTALYAWQPPPYSIYAPGLGMPAADVAAAERRADEVISDALKRAREAVPAADGVAVTARAVLGPAPQVLAAASRHTDFVVVGSRDLGAVDRVVLGSTSSALLHHTHCPVVVVPQATRAQEGGRVVVGVDPSAAGTAALGWGAGEAERRGWPLLVVHVRPSATEVVGAAGPVELQAAELSWLTAQIATVVPRDLAEPEIRVGHPGSELVRGLGVDDLLVLGSRGRGALLGWLLGSTSVFAARHAPCPVVVVREPVAAD